MGRDGQRRNRHRPDPQALEGVGQAGENFGVGQYRPPSERLPDLHRHATSGTEVMTAPLTSALDR